MTGIGGRGGAGRWGRMPGVARRSNLTTFGIARPIGVFGRVVGHAGTVRRSGFGRATWVEEMVLVSDRAGIVRYGFLTAGSRTILGISAPTGWRRHRSWADSADDRVATATAAGCRPHDRVVDVGERQRPERPLGGDRRSPDGDRSRDGAAAYGVPPGSFRRRRRGSPSPRAAA